MSALSKFFEAPRIADSLRIVGSGLFMKPAQAKYTINGKAPTVEDIMTRFGVDRGYAEAFLRRNA